ncbi:MAG: c-type cytochrome [Nitrospinota bacterium]
MLFAFFCGALSAFGLPAAHGRQPSPGAALYAKECAICHGIEGKGDGLAAQHLDPRPRDFTSGLFKFRTTATGELPADEDLFRTISEGIPGTSMPAFGVGAHRLTEGQIRSLVSRVKEFSPDFQDEDLRPEKMPMPGKPPPRTPTLLRTGRELYQQAAKGGCVVCHGASGRGDGKEAGTHKDDWGDPILPANITRAWRFKRGASVRDIFWTLSTGLNGTPMPGYTDSLSETQRWALAYYTHSLLDQTVSEKGPVGSWFLKGKVPTEPDDPRWQMARPIEIPLFGQVIVKPRWPKPAIDSVRVRSLHNGRTIAFLLEWDDRTRSGSKKGSEALPDRVAILFPVRALHREWPHFLWGQRGREENIWQWSAGSSQVLELNASGPQRLRRQSSSGQEVQGRASYMDGRWRVVLRRHLITNDREHDAQVPQGRSIPFALMAWDGSRGEEGLRGAISSWHLLQVDSSKGPHLKEEKNSVAATRVVHPFLPSKYVGLENPFRRDRSARSRYLKEGEAIYAANCIFCHGDGLDGRGHFARALTLPPADLTSPESLASLHESYAFWRVREGWAALPPESKPWLSAMPRWKEILTEEETWKVLLYLYDRIGVRPHPWY